MKGHQVKSVGKVVTGGVLWQGAACHDPEGNKIDVTNRKPELPTHANPKKAC